ncbi:uncharacterized protein LOC108342670 isoform X2 [Vigna angularis]|uniref:uncharacterized protein LOC108342670 isoform X2 n=1 Tax=Phaseolus angularis TaxID=3914 RepID=UPI0022B4351C|nr:uncharacterized protein LOC108342670 isoform X2 [Vigna angularis]
MSAIIVCGKRSALFQELPPKRIRCCSSSSPVRLSPSSLLHHLAAFFPDMDNHLLEKALEDCGNDIDSAIRSLNQLRLGASTPPSLRSTPIASDATLQSQEVSASEDPVTGQNYPTNGAEWVELFVKEMMNASNMNDAKARASKMLEALEKSICMRTSVETERNFQQENTALKEQVEALVQENVILKRAICIQHERQKEYEDRDVELQQLEQLVSQYQEQVRALEVNNYALTMHLKQAEQSSSIPGRFHPDVF